ncbi:MAG: dihydrolipoyllysine-residue succinyltransferase [Gammaproteobacteria bacterium CG22_combo_CG10-13_8_21_14_all_40_8]|nr:MAG: dihydrolipoyllysine-residue succinyltransferase [Gammaproteobacteria bacterium CG22_combo_CG10-13_8_21_14_all_40_8]
MSLKIQVPTLPESVADATIATWHKKVGDFCERDENIVDIETDKVVLEVVAPDDGVIEEIVHDEGATVNAHDVIGLFKATSAAISSTSTEEKTSHVAAAASPAQSHDALSPAVRRLVSEHGLDPESIRATGKDGRLSKEDVEAYLKAQTTQTQKPISAPESSSQVITPKSAGAREQKRVPMTRLRKRVAERLVSVQQNSAILTTFNEVNMQPVMELRQKYKEVFEKTHNSRLGFMSFFTKAVIEGLKRYPDLNASIDGDDIVYHGYFDIGIAVSAPRGLVVPILRDADSMSFADIETNIRTLGKKAQDNKLTMEELTGGTFTITNGGVFGSMMSTPIINPPQSGILGMHGITDRAVVIDGEIVVRPMMYIALSYDHRIVDGRESVGFLKTVKELIEDPARLLLEV